MRQGRGRGETGVDEALCRGVAGDLSGGVRGVGEEEDPAVINFGLRGALTENLEM